MSDIVLNELQREQLRGAVQEMVESHYRNQAEKDLRREIAARVAEELKIPKKTFNSLALRAYKNDAVKINMEVTEILDLAEELGFYTHEED